MSPHQVQDAQTTRVAYIFDRFPCVYERFLVLDVISRGPRLYLVSVPLQLLDFLLEVLLQLLLLGCPRRGRADEVLELVVDATKGSETFGDALERAVNLLQLLAESHGRERRLGSEQTIGW